MSNKLTIVPIFQDEAFAFIEQIHKHHKKPVGSVFQLAVQNDENKIVGVAVVGRPVSRMLQDGFTLEVTRNCTDGTKNVCSCLYAACWRVAKELGYRRLITYILNNETGISVKAAGWTLIGERGGGSWDTPSRGRVDKHPIQKKILFDKTL